MHFICWYLNLSGKFMGSFRSVSLWPKVSDKGQKAVYQAHFISASLVQSHLFPWSATLWKKCSLIFPLICPSVSEFLLQYFRFACHCMLHCLQRFLLFSNLLLTSPDNREVKLNALQSRTKISFLYGNRAEGFCLRYSRYSFFWIYFGLRKETAFHAGVLAFTLLCFLCVSRK